jgi:hypothetical protein
LVTGANSGTKKREAIEGREIPDCLIGQASYSGGNVTEGHPLHSPSSVVANAGKISLQETMCLP